MKTMNGKENDKVINGELSSEQKALITQKFKAAKALLARKRPHPHAFSSSLHLTNSNSNEMATMANSTERTPLSEISMNSQKKVTKLYNGDSSISKVKATENSFEKAKIIPNEDITGLTSFITPVRLNVCSNLNHEPVTSSSLFDDYFDESIFEQIDAVCEQNSAKSQIQSSYIPKNQHNTELYTIFGNNLEDELKFTQEDTKNTQNMPEDYQKYIHSLNDKQQEAACSDISTPLMIIAGPGSGKTSTMVGRVLKLMSEGIGPSNILAMTFTTAAVAEMRDRIAKVAGKSAAKELTISTFHSFSLQLCRSYAEKLDRTSEFLIYGHGQQRKAITEAVRLLEDSKKLPSDNNNGSNSLQYFKDKSKKWLNCITKAKASGKTPEDFRKTGGEIEATIFEKYSEILKTCNALDYHDLISCSLKLLSDFPEVFKESQELWKAIVIDEFQDTSAMQYGLLCKLASHKHITVIGDDDQSIFSFNGADISGFDSFRKDFPQYKEVRLNKNYRSTRCIVEAASFLIQNNKQRCKSKSVLTDNISGSKITVKECSNEAAQCSFVVDKILEISSNNSSDNNNNNNKCSSGNIAVLYRRQVSGKIFQTAFRDRKIPFNIHGVAFYRKKVVKAIIAMLKTTLPGCEDGEFRRVFKALLPSDKEEKTKMIEHIDKVSTVRKCSFISAAFDIFNAKISGTFKRSQLTQGRKVLLTLDMISKLVQREQSISAVVTSVANMIPQKYLIEQRAVVDIEGRKLLNEDNDIRSVLQYLLDDVSDFIKTKYISDEENDIKGGINVLKAFIDYISEREAENFRSRKRENEDSVTLTTIHQSKGLEWDTVFIVKANETEIPLLHEYNGAVNENGTSIEEERRLLYVAMTRAKKKLYILYLTMDSNWQILQPSRFLREIPRHLLDTQDGLDSSNFPVKNEKIPQKIHQNVCNEENLVDESANEAFEAFNGNSFLKRFNSENRAVISHLFRQWAKKAAFQDPKRLLDKVSFVIDERIAAKKTPNKDVLRSLKTCIKCDEAFQYANAVLQWEKMPADTRAYIMREKQEHFQKLRMENSMGSSAATTKQISYLQSLGCTVVPTSRLHASRLIEEYKSV